MAEQRVRPYVTETPLRASPAFSEAVGADVYFKLECLQVTGSFKARGAFSKLLSLDAATRSRGVIAASTGNHGAAVAYALQALGAPGAIFVPTSAAAVKVANIRRFGADVRFYGNEAGATELHARAFARDQAMAYAPPYNDEDVVAGQATVGVELLRQLPDIEAAIVPIGGGGLIGGVAGYLKAQRPETTIIGASARNSKAMMASIEAGRVIEVGHKPTLADGLAGGIEPGTITFALCQRYVDLFVDVDEAAIRAAMRTFIDIEHVLLEGAACVAVAALLAEKERLAGRRVAVIVSGANIGADRLKEAL